MPAPTLNVVIETPESDQGETAENPIPAPKAKSSKVKAAVATAPAATAAQETADICVSSDSMLGDVVRDKVSIISLRPRRCAPALNNYSKMLHLVDATISLLPSALTVSPSKRNVGNVHYR